MLRSVSPPTQTLVLKGSQCGVSPELKELLTDYNLDGIRGALEVSGLTSINQIYRKIRHSKNETIALLIKHRVLRAEVNVLCEAIDALVDMQEPLFPSQESVFLYADVLRWSLRDH